MPDMHIKPAGSWKSIDDCKVKVSNAWKQVDSIYVKVAGAWKKVWDNAVYALNGGIYIDSVGDGSRACEAGVTFNTDGTEDIIINGGVSESSNWVTPTSIASEEEHWVYVARSSGDSAGWTGTLNTWLKISGSGSSAQTFKYNVSAGAGLLSGVYDISVAGGSGGTPLYATDQYTFTANSEVS